MGARGGFGRQWVCGDRARFVRVLVRGFEVEPGNLSLSITDSNQQTFPATLVYVSRSQINFVVPDGVATGAASLILKAGPVMTNIGAVEIRRTAPALFSIDGDAAAVPLEVNGVTYWSLYGTGFRNAPRGTVKVSVGGVSVPVLYAGAQPDYPALDQINIQSPAALGPVQVTTSDGTSNTVTLRIK